MKIKNGITGEVMGDLELTGRAVLNNIDDSAKWQELLKGARQYTINICEVHIIDVELMIDGKVVKKGKATLTEPALLGGTYNVQFTDT